MALSFNLDYDIGRVSLTMIRAYLKFQMRLCHNPLSLRISLMRHCENDNLRLSPTDEFSLQQYRRVTTLVV